MGRRCKQDVDIICGRVLGTRIAGEILQKFVTYQVKLAIVGDFADASETLKSFIYESNRGTQIFFVEDVEMAKKRLFAAK